MTLSHKDKTSLRTDKKIAGWSIMNNPSFPCAMPICVAEQASWMDKTRGTNMVPGIPCVTCCPICKDLDRNAVAVAHNDILLNIAMSNMTKHIKEYHRGMSKSHSGNGKHQGSFAFTLTMSPDDKLSEEDMISAVRKIMSQKSCPVSKYAWYLEYRDLQNKTGAHIHGMYETETGGRIEAKHWKRAWPIWDEKKILGNGFRGGYHRPVRSGESYNEYIQKQGVGVYDVKMP